MTKPMATAAELANPLVADACALLRECAARAEERALAAGPEAYAEWLARQDEATEHGDD